MSTKRKQHMLKRITKIISLIIGTWIFISVDAHAQITITYVGPNPIPATNNCQAFHKFKNADFNIVVDSGCVVSDTLVIQNPLDTTGVLTGGIYNVIVQVYTSGGCGDTIRNFIIPVQDVNPPTILHQPDSLTVIQCSGPSGNQNALTDWLNKHGGAIAYDNCTLPGSISWTTDPPAVLPIDFCTPTDLVVKFIAHDNFGNTAQTNLARFRIIDNVAPTIISTPKSITYACNKNLNYNSLILNWLNTLADNTAIANDNCLGIFVNWYVKIDNGPEKKWPTDITINENGCNASKSVTFIAKDDCGNSVVVGTASFSITDTIKPTLFKSAVSETHQCNGNSSNQSAFLSWLNNRGGARFKDNCTDSLNISMTTIPINPFLPSNACNDSIAVSFIGTDACGNKTTSKATFYLIDNQPPAIYNVPNDTTFYCTLSNLPPIPPNVVAADNCAQNIVANFKQETIAGPCGPNSEINRSWTAQDNCGNITTRIQKIQIIDTIPPVITGTVPPDVTVNCENIPGTPPIGNFSATDDCSNTVVIEFKEINKSSACNGGFIIERLWIAKDKCGNADSLSQKITVLDNIPPALFGVPADVNVNCANIPTPPIIGVGINATDNCDQSVSIVLDEQSTIAACLNNQYTITRTWIATDDCGNFTSGKQTIQVTDNDSPSFMGTPVDITVDCANVPGPPILGGSFKAVDGCDPSVNVNFTQINNQDPDLKSCGHYNYTITRFWVANDDCGHVTTATQKVEVLDDLAPSLFCVDTFVLANDPLDCKAIKGINELVFFSDGCSNTNGTDSISQTLFLSHSGADIQISPVDPLNFSLPVQGVPAAYLTGNIVLQIDLDNVDGESPTEFFNIYAEDGSLIGTTNHTNIQCGNSTTIFANLSPAKVNQWAFDGYIQFVLLTNGKGVNAINNFCQGGNVKVSLKYDFLTSPKQSSSLYYSIDNKAFKQFVAGFKDTFSLGNHQVKVKIEDCSGKFDSCSYILKVRDADAPHISCPSDKTVESLPFDCNVLLDLPDPLNISDNCGFSSVASAKTIPINLFFQDYPQIGKVPEDVIANFFGSPPIGNGSLKVYVKGDIAQPGEFFNVYDENSNLLGKTGQGSIAKECLDYEKFTFPVTQAQISQWSLDGVIRFTLKANVNTTLYTDFINPCGPLEANGKDPKSMVYFELVYPAYDVNYVVRDSNNVIIATEKFMLGNTIADLPLGKNNITYTVIDGGDNIGTCSFKITVVDKSPPKISCKSGTIIELNPSGLVQNNVTATELLISQYDNCGIKEFNITPNNFDCNVAGTGTMIKIVAKDYSGNKDSCSSVVFFKNETLTPSITLDTCGGVLTFIPDTTFKKPTPSKGDYFTYTWAGPNGFLSNLPSPTLLAPGPAYSGLYTLTVTGLTGCQSSGSVNVVIDQDGLFKPTLYSNSPVCEGDSIHIYTDWNGALNYTWTNLNTQQQIVTSKNFLRLPATNQNSGLWNVKVGLNIGCASLASIPQPVQVSLVSANATDTVGVCKGSKVTLNVDAINGSIFQWTAPNGIVYFGKNPEIPSMEGYYKVKVTNTQGCVGYDSSYVKINIRPEITALSHSCPGCVSGTENCTIEPSVFPVNKGQYTYQWYNPSGLLFSIDSIASLLNINGTASGEYVLVVTDKTNTCASTPSKIIISINNTPPTPLISQDGSGNPVKLCEGQPLVIKLASNPYSGNVKYIWNTPLGPDTTSIPSISFASATVNNAGFYELQVLINGCMSNSSNKIFAEVNPIPFPPATLVNSPLCEGDTLKLSADLIAGATYEWTGPTGVFSNLQNPFITNAKPGDSGQYRVRITLKGCTSLFSAANNVIVNIIPDAPSLDQQCNGSICGSDTNATCLLKAIAPFAFSGSSFSFYKENGQLISGPFSADSLYLNNLAQYGKGLQSFYATVSTKGCESSKSNILKIQFDTIPNLKAYAGNDQKICENEIAKLCATSVNIGFGVWSQIAGPSVQILSPFTNCTGLEGYTGNENLQFAWSLSNGACMNYSVDTLNLSVSDLQIASAFPLVKVCKDEKVTINALTGDGKWTQSDTQTQAGVTIVDANAMTTEIQNFTPNKSYYFYWNVDNGACGKSEAEVIVEVFDDMAFAGTDKQDCGLGCLNLPLLADKPLFGSGVWTSVNPGIFFNDPDNPQTSVCGLKDGNNMLIWTTNGGVCGENSVDTIIINYQYISIASADTFNVPFASARFIDVLANDSLNSDFTLKLIESPIHGKLNNLGNGKFVYSANPDFIGQDYMKYQLCSVICPEQCSEAVVVFSIGGTVTCTTPSIITPNGDGVNDSFIIPCLALLDKYPSNVLSVFNQWGDEIYHASPYKNNWEGTYQGNPVPAGTYYYILDLGDGTKPVAGFLIVKK